MKDEFIVRLDMFTRSLGVLDAPANRPIWENQPPAIFTAKVGEARDMVATLRDTQQRQEAGTTGAALDKDREEDELEVAADVLGDAVVTFFEDRGDFASAVEVDLTPSEWRDLRDQQLVAKSQLVIDRATALTTGPDAASAAAYGITPAAVAALAKEQKDYRDLLSAPAVAIALRAALTRGLRPAFRLVEAKFQQIDRLIGQFGKTPAGREMVAAWTLARDPAHAVARPAPAAPTLPTA